MSQATRIRTNFLTPRLGRSAPRLHTEASFGIHVFIHSFIYTLDKYALGMYCQAWGTQKMTWTGSLHKKIAESSGTHSLVLKYLFNKYLTSRRTNSWPDGRQLSSSRLGVLWLLSLLSSGTGWHLWSPCLRSKANDQSPCGGGHSSRSGVRPGLCPLFFEALQASRPTATSAQLTPTFGGTGPFEDLNRIWFFSFLLSHLALHCLCKD